MNPAGSTQDIRRDGVNAFKRRRIPALPAGEWNTRSAKAATGERKMENRIRLIDANAPADKVDESKYNNPHPQGMGRVNHRNEHDHFLRMIMDAPTVDAVEVSCPKLLHAVRLLVKQYEHSKQANFVHDPIAHAFYYTWKQLDNR